MIESRGRTFLSSKPSCVLLHVWGFRRMLVHTESETLAQPDGCDGIPFARHCLAESAPDGLTTPLSAPNFCKPSLRLVLDNQPAPLQKCQEISAYGGCLTDRLGSERWRLRLPCHRTLLLTLCEEGIEFVVRSPNSLVSFFRPGSLLIVSSLLMNIS